MHRTLAVSTLVAFLTGATAVVWSTVLAHSASGVLTVAFLDVGQGDAIYIEAPNGAQALIDGGNGMAVVRELGRMMPRSDRSLDLVLATHPDQDHIGGLPGVFARYDVGAFLDPGVRDDGADYEALLQAVDEEGLAPVYAREGMTIALDTDVYFTILFPNTDVQDFEPNTGSIVARITYGDTSFLFTGDSPSAIEQYLAGRYGVALQSDVLKLGHHGSRTSSSEPFLGVASPTYGIVSAGCNNAYGHPHSDVRARMEQFGIETLATCDEGTIVFVSDGTTVLRER